MLSENEMEEYTSYYHYMTENSNNAGDRAEESEQFR